MGYITPYQYYTNGGVVPADANWGSYQYVTLSDVLNNFTLMYVGLDKQLVNVRRHEMLFHIKQAIKLLNYDAMRDIKTIELEVSDNLKFILPSNYVDYIRISLNINGVLRPLVENRRPNSAQGYLQDNNNNLLFDVNGDVLIGTSKLDLDRINQTAYSGVGPYNGVLGWNVDGDWYFGYNVGARFGLETSEANSSPTFRIQNGVIDFSSGVANQLVVLEYISDGMANGSDTDIQVHKFAEEFVYRYVKWALLNAKTGITEYERTRAKKEKEAELRNTKIRLSNIHPSRLLMSLRGQNKIIK
jgi:hypothetical protein